MDLVDSIILGIIQGLTEFLPVSSSAHLVFGTELLGLKENVTFDIVLHLGTLIAVLLYFRTELLDLLLGTIKHSFAFVKYALFSLTQNANKENLYYPYYSFYIIVATIPAGIAGIVFKEKFECFFAEPVWVCIFLLITGCFLIASKYAPEKNTKIGFWQALLIGLSQMCAILPGISRSGSTIVTGMFLGINREQAAKFSFFMSIPVILGAVVLKLKDLFALDLSSHDLMCYAVGTLASAIFGYISILLVMKFIQKGKFVYFGYYCLAVGILGLFYFN
jgi:undecaprenyl-diphosphatase